MLQIPIHSLASGTAQSQLFIGSFTLDKIDALISVHARLLDKDTLLGSDSVDIRALPAGH